MPPRRRPTKAKPPPIAFAFPKLPIELRLKVWGYTIKSEFVKLEWDSAQRTFTSNRKIPALLHTCQESRYEGLKHYRLAFASSPEFARVYFNFELDYALFGWSTLGSSPGRLGRKLSEEDCKDLQCLLVNESRLLQHAEEGLRELERFPNLHCIGVICDKLNPEEGGQYGGEALAEFSAEVDEGITDLETRTERWPELICLRDHGELYDCSRHWWFDGWNQRAGYPQRAKWPGAMAKCVEATKEDDTVDDAGFLYYMMMSNAVGDAGFDFGSP